nr:transcription repressor OFP7-like isoform X2 [Ipomoea batatas]
MEDNKGQSSCASLAQSSESENEYECEYQLHLAKDWRTRITQQLNNSTKFITAVDFPVTNTHRSSSALRRHVSSALISVGCSLTSCNSGDDNDEEVDDGDDFGEANVREGGSGTAVAVLSVFEFEAVPWDYRRRFLGDLSGIILCC